MGEETYPVAVQKSDGSIHLMFRDGNRSSTLQIGQIWSSDNGYTWTGHSVFANSAEAKQLSLIGSQGGGQNVTVVAGIFNGANWYVNHWISWDNGLTWSGGCRGPVFTYSANANFFAAKRYDWSSSCQY